jgi:elongation factor P
MRAKDVRKGNVIIYKSVPHRVADFQHRTPGNLRAFVQMKLRNILNGSMVDARFSSDEDLPAAEVITFKATFLYNDAEGYHFMNTESYEQIALSEESVGDARYYLLEGTEVEVSEFDERPIGISLPKTVVLTVEECPPEMKGATASNSPKPARTNTGLQLNVPPFIKIGERIIVDTEDGSYLSRE